MGVSRRLFLCPHDRITSNRVGCRRGNIYLTHISVRAIERWRFSAWSRGGIIDHLTNPSNAARVHEGVIHCASGRGGVAHARNVGLVLCQRFPAADVLCLAVAARPLLAGESSTVRLSKLVRCYATIILRRSTPGRPLLVSCGESAFICSFAANTCFSPARLLDHSNAEANGIARKGMPLRSDQLGPVRAAGLSNHRSRR